MNVVPNSPAAQAGVRQSDIITAVNDQPVNRSGDLRRILRGLAPGDQASLTVVRPTGTVTLNVTLAQAPAG